MLAAWSNSSQLKAVLLEPTMFVQVVCAALIVCGTFLVARSQRFVKDKDQETFDKDRAAELKHGRVVMLATQRRVLQHYARSNLVAPEKFIPLTGPKGLGALSEGEPDSAAPGLLFLMAGFVELSVLKHPEGASLWDFGDPAMFGVMGALSAELHFVCDAVGQ